MMTLKPYTLALALTTAFSPAAAQETFPPGHPVYDDPANGVSYVRFDCLESGRVWFYEERNWPATEVFHAASSEPRINDPLIEPRRYGFAMSPKGEFLSLDNQENRQKVKTGEFPVGYHGDDTGRRILDKMREICFSIS